ncbi:unnamed protein product [Closterium sp. NIES-54]
MKGIEDHFLSLDPTSLIVDLLEQHLLAAETSAKAVGAARGTLRTPFFEGCSPSPLAPSYAFAAAVDVLSTQDVGAASASAKRCSSKGKGGRGGARGSGGGGGGSSGGGGGSGGGGSGGSGGGSGGIGGGGGGSGGSGGSGSGGSGGGRTGAQCGGSRGDQRQRQKRRSKTPSPQQLREWLIQGGAGGGSVSCPYRPHWAELLRSGVAIFHLDYDAILSAMYALSASAEGDCYRCVPPDPGIDAAALCASKFVLSGTAPAQALHTFTLNSGASRYFFCDSTTLTPLPALVPVRLANPSEGPVVARSSTVLPCPAVPSGSLSGFHLPSFSMNLVSTAALQDAMVTTTTPGGQRVSQVNPFPGTAPAEVAFGSGAARGAASGGVEPGVAESGGAGSGGAEPGGEEPGGAEREGVEPGGSESEGGESEGAEPRGAALSGGPVGASPRLSPRPEPLSSQQLREWLVWHAAGAGGARVTAGAGGAGGTAAAGPGGACTKDTGAAGTSGVGGAGAGDPTEPEAAGAGGCGTSGAGAGGAGAGGTGAGDAGAGGAGVGGTGAGGARAERREPASCPASLVRTARRVPHSRPPPVLGTHTMTLRPSSISLHVPLPAPPDSSLPEVPDLESDRARAASPTVSCLLANAVTDPSFESAAASALDAELLYFATACRLDYDTALVVEYEFASPPSVGGEFALGMDVLEDRHEDFECLAAAVPRFASMLLAPEGDPDASDIPTPRSYAEAITGPYSSKWQAAMDAEMASWKSTCTYVDVVPSNMFARDGGTAST